MYQSRETMKKLYFFFATLLLLATGSTSLNAQCPYDNDYYTDLSAPSVIGASVGEGNCIFAGEYYTLTGLQAGSTYRISTCTTTDVADTRITVYAQGGSGGAISFNDDFCGLLSRLDFTPSADGTYDILVDATGPGNTCTSISECVEMTITLIGTSGSNSYCIPSYTVGTANGDFINGVSLGSINNQNSGSASGASYRDYTSLSTGLSANTAYTLDIKNNPDFAEIVSAWIDYNQDFEFSEDERLGQVNIGANATGSINFTTDANPLAGATRLRVRMVFSVPVSGGSVSPCTSSQYGETEDYTVDFSSDPPGPPSGLTFSTACGLSTSIQDNACPNNTLSTITVAGLTSLGTTHILNSAAIIIEHPLAADLDLYLESPSGQVVELSTDNGGSGADYGSYTVGNCTQTAKFIMNASTPISGSTAPFLGSYLPEGDLNDFNAGTNPNGLWKLRACDDFSGDVGTIRYFELNFALNATEPPACSDSYTIVDGSTNVVLDQILSWVPGDGDPTSYDVYFGTAADALVLVSDNQSGTSYNPGALNPNTTYYYQVVPSNNAGDATGCPVISFTTVDAGAITILQGNSTVTTCAGNFFDSGGVNDNYSNNELSVLTILPETPGSAIEVSFSSFNTDNLFDFLAIADGADENAPVIGIYTGTDSPGTITATNPTGALTFLFISDDAGNFSGWSASVNCVPLSDVPVCSANTLPADGTTEATLGTQISWDAVSGATGYDVYFGTSATPDLVQSGTTATSYDPGALLNSTTYYYSIVPVNGNGAATGCAINSFTTSAVTGTVILMQNGSITSCNANFYDSGNVSGDYSSDESYTLTIQPEVVNGLVQVVFNSFSSEEDIDQLLIYSGSDASGTLLQTLTGTISSPVTVTSNVVGGALTFVFNSDFQVEGAGWDALVSCVSLPDAPACVIPSLPLDNAVDLALNTSISWTPGLGEAPETYDVYFGTDSDALILVSDNQVGTSYTPSGLLNGTTYYWSVIASNLGGNSATVPSDCFVNSFTTVEALQAPACVVPSSPADDATGVALNVSISWTEGAGDPADTYDVYFGLAPDALVLVSDNQTETSYSPAGQLNNTVYYWSVIASNEAGSSSITPEDCFVNSYTTVEELQAPTCPVLSSPLNNAVDVALDASISWTAGIGAVTDSYDVFFGTASDALVLVSDNQTGLSYSPVGLLNNTVYYWSVVANNTAGSSEDCSVNSFTTIDLPVTTDILMQEGSVSACTGNFYDTGDIDGEYQDDEELTLTITPDVSGNLLQIDFTAFDIEDGWDFLTIYDGNSIAAPLIDSYTGTDGPGLVTSTATDGSLTFVFSSDGTGTAPGWEAVVSCIDPNAAPSCAISLSPANAATNVSVAPTLTWEQGTGLVTGYNIYFGTAADALVLVSAGQTETSFSPGTLDLNTSYFWQVVPVNGLISASDCSVQEFTTEAQANIVMQNNTLTVCDANFYDSGNSTGDYTSDENYTLTFLPATPGTVIEVIFNEFEIEQGETGTIYDSLIVYDGPDNTFPQIGIFSGTTIPGPFISTHPTGALTFHFSSDGSVDLPGWSASVNCTDLEALPPCANNYSPADAATEVSANGTVLSWSSAGGSVTGYDVYFGTATDALVLVSANQTESSFNPPSLDLNTTYYWQVVPINSNGSAVGCVVNSFTTSAIIDVVMTNATITTCSANFYDSGNVDGEYSIEENYTLTFLPDSPNNAIQVTFNSFDLEQSTFSGTIYDSLIVYNGPDNTYPLIGVFSGTTIPGPFVSSDPSGALTFYFSSDVSVTQNGWDADVICISTGEVPSCATGLTPADLATDVSFTSQLSWSIPSGIVVGYDVYFGTDPDALVLVSDDQTATTFDPGTLELGTTYYWQVIPYNESGSATGCSVQSFTTGATADLVIYDGELTICDANLFDTGGADGDYELDEDYTLTIYPSTPGSFVQLDFTSFDLEDGWDFLDIYNGNSATGTADVSLTGTDLPAQFISTAADGSVTLNFLSDGSTNQAGFEIAISCFLPVEVPQCVTNPNPADSEAEAPINAVLSWSPALGFPAGYDVYFGTAPDALLLVSDDQVETTYTPGGLISGTTYYWQIVPYNNAGSSVDCQVFSFTTGEEESVNMFEGTITTCASNFYDSQGPDGEYLVDEASTLVVYPAQANNVMRVTFNSFISEDGFDELLVYSGESAGTGTLLATLTGEDVVTPVTFTSTDVSGALTFVFTSDVSVVDAGWDADLVCVSTTEIPGCVTNPVPADAAIDISATTTVLSWGLGTGVALTYDVYFGTDPDALALVSAGQSETTFNPGPLDLSTVYYWQVVPANTGGSAVGCAVYSFTTGSLIDIIMSNATITTCGANFFDSGNSTGDYAIDEDYVLTILPATPGNSIQVNFTSFNIENTWDFLTVYNGNSTAAPVLFTFTGNAAGGTIPTAPITSTASDGSLTFEFTSDATVVRFGWTADVTCIDATQPPSCAVITSGPADGATDVCINEAVYTWTSGPGAPATSYDVYLDFGSGPVLVSDDQASTSFDPGLLDTNTTYIIQIVPSNLNGEAVGCPSITFSTGTCLNYCDAGATNCDEYIADVQMGNISNATDCTVGGYNDYTSLSADVYVGTSTPITITNGTLEWTGDQCGIWIDWNHDGDFGDANETIAVTGTPGTGPYTANVIPPVDAVIGSTIMRVRITFTGALDPCGTALFGEVEDYSINVFAPLACPYPNNITTSETTTTTTVVTWDEVTDALEYQVRYRLASEATTVASWATPLVIPAPLTFTFLENLIACEDYIIQIGSVCEVGSEVTFSSNTLFGTRCIECSTDYTAEGENCGEDLNGGCNSGVFGSINCGETICGTSFYDGTTRDTDWFQFDVTSAGVYTVNVLAEFDGTIFFADANDCNNILTPSQGNFVASEAFTLATSLPVGTYTVIIVPSFDQAPFTCSDFNSYTLGLSSGVTQIAPVADVCETTPAFDLFAIPAGGTWSGTGITDVNAGTFDPTVSGTGSFDIIYQAVGTGCASSDTITINVGSAPVADFVGLASNYCSSVNEVVLTGIPAGGIFAISPSIPGAIAGNVLNPSLLDAGSYDVTYTVSLGSSTCAGSITQTFTVTDGPVVSIDGLASAICSQDSPLTLSGTPSTGTFSGNGVTGTSFDASVSGVGPQTITYTVTEVGNVCPGIATAVIQVNPAPVVTISGVSGDYCLNSTSVTMVGTPALGTFSIDGTPSGSTFDPATAGIGSHILRYEFDNGTCVGFDEVTVNVVDNLTVTINNLPATICSKDDPILLSSTPAGAVFSGAGVIGGNTFDPSQVTVGSHTITATYSNGNCTAVATQTIVVNPEPVASFNYSANGSTVVFSNSSINATSYSWNFGDNSGLSTATNPTHTYSANGSYTIELTASSADCGTSTFTVQLELSVGIGSIEGVDMIQLYPNPTSGNVMLAFNSLNQQSFEVRITDATGRLIQTDAFTNYMGKFNKMYDLSDKAKGVYLFTVSSEKGSINFRVVRD